MFNTRKKIVYDFHFKAVNLTDFELKLDFNLKGKLAVYARKGMIKAIKAKTGKNIGKVDVWEDIPGSMFGFVNLQAKSFIKSIEENSLKPDGIKIIHHKTTGGQFKDNLKVINLKLNISGQYLKV